MGERGGRGEREVEQSVYVAAGWIGGASNGSTPGRGGVSSGAAERDGYTS